MSDSEIKTITEVIRLFLSKTQLCNFQIEERKDDIIPSELIISDAIELCMNDPEYANKLGRFCGYSSTIQDDELEFQMRVFYKVNCAYRQKYIDYYLEDTSKKYPSDTFLRDNEYLQGIWETIVLDHTL